MNLTDFGACRIPRINPFDPLAMNLVTNDLEPVRCKVERRATLSNGALRITGEKQTYEKDL